MFLLLLIGIPSLIFLIRKPSYLIVAQLVSSVLCYGLMAMGLNQNLAYVCDILTALLFFHILFHLPDLSYKLQPLALPFFILLLLLTVNIVSAIYNHVPFLHFLWGMRYDYRFIIFLIGCVFFIDEKFMDTLWKATLILLTLQVIICSLEFWIFTFEQQDTIGGTFGLKGGTGYLVSFFTYTILLAYNRYRLGLAKLSTVLYIILLSTYVAIINEGKALPLFLLPILLIAFFQDRFSIRKVRNLFILLIVAYFVFYAFNKFSPWWEQDFFTLDALSKYAFTDDYNGADVTRFNGPLIFKEYFDNIQNLIGAGLGNATPTTRDFLTGDFYQTYSATNYSWFAISYIYVESGWIGLILYIAFFISFLTSAFKIRFYAHKSFVGFGVAMVLICLLTTCYNNSLFTEHIGYMSYLFLAIPFAMASPDYINPEELEYDEEMFLQADVSQNVPQLS